MMKRKKRIHDSQIVRAKENQAEPWCAQSKTSIRQKQTNKIYM